MHASSLENMQKCYDRFLTPMFFDKRESVTVLDIGAADVNGSYRAIFRHPKISYVGFDMEEGPCVDVVLGDSYNYPLPASAVMNAVMNGGVWGQLFHSAKAAMIAVFAERFRCHAEYGLWSAKAGGGL